MSRLAKKERESLTRLQKKKKVFTLPRISLRLLVKALSRWTRIILPLLALKTFGRKSNRL